VTTISQSLDDLREAMAHTCSLVEGQIRDIRADYERKMSDIVAEFRKSLATTAAKLEGERDEARRHVSILTDEIRALKLQQAPPALPVYGLYDCKQCGQTFSRATKGQKTCPACKRAQSQRLAAHLRKPGGLNVHAVPSPTRS
jgi:rubrerythrin